ncbi:MAG TPA: hypothetical protein VHU24_09845 [Solirubrobacterales bacterium]|jgi:hypothetical protein|nr:hypothetical protein [Solirubrobacterales bacterium]
MKPRKIAALLGTVVAVALPAGAQAAVLHDQANNFGFYFNPSDDYRPSQNQYDNQLADDFTVPPGQSWKLSQVDLVGTAPATGLVSIVNAWIYGTAGTLPGAQLFQQLGIAATNQPNYSVPLSGTPSLDPGVYWISVQQTDAFNMTPTWDWKTRTVQDGNPAAFRNPPGGFLSGQCRDWTKMQTCFPSAAVDLAWSVSGTASSLPVTFGAVKRHRNGTALLQVTVPAAGTLTLSGMGIKGSSAQVAARKAASTVTFKIKATGKAKKKLKAKGKVKVNPAITYTATGAAPTTTTEKVKLRKG